MREGSSCASVAVKPRGLCVVCCVLNTTLLPQGGCCALSTLLCEQDCCVLSTSCCVSEALLLSHATTLCVTEGRWCCAAVRGAAAARRLPHPTTAVAAATVAAPLRCPPHRVAQVRDYSLLLAAA